MKTDVVRTHFLQQNKVWIIKNLKQVVNMNNFYDNDGYLLKLYQRLVDDELKLQNEKKRLEFIELKKSEQGLARLDPNVDDKMHHEGEGSEPVLRLKKTQVKNVSYLLNHWYYFAKQNLYLKGLVSEFEERQAQLLCEKCGLDTCLKTIPQIPLVDIMSRYRIEYAGLPFNKYDWIKFYEKKQKFMTLCPDCEVIEQMKKVNLRRGKSGTKSISKMNSSQALPGEKLQAHIAKPTKIILKDWLMRAKSSLLHLKPQT